MKRSITILSILFTCMFAHAQNQVPVYNSGVLFIAADTVTMGFEFTNANAANLTNNGILEIKGDINNYQTMTNGGTGVLILNGDASQNINGTAAFRTNNLITNNNEGVYLNNELKVAGNHIFQNGMITTADAAAFLTYESNANYTNATDAKHVNGWVKKMGNTAFTFPVGNASLLRDITIQNLSTTAEFKCRYNAMTPNPTQTALPIVLVNNFEYWNLDRISGGTAKVLINWNNAKVTCPPYTLNEIRVVQYNNGLWTSRGGTATGNVLSTGTVLSDVTDNFGMVTFGSTNWFLEKGNISLTGTRTAGTSKIQWQYKGDNQPVAYEIERSNDGVTFTSLAKVSATANTNTYNFVDTKPVTTETFWYRIKGIAANGNGLYSTVITLNEQQTGLKVTTVATNKTIHVTAHGSLAGNYHYTVVNMNGQLMQQGNITANNGAIVPIAMPSANTGNYVLLLENAGVRKATKIFVQ